MSRIRRIIQAFFFFVFLGLMIATTKQIDLPFQTHLFLAADPLVTVTSLFAGQAVALTIIMSSIMIIISILFGRIFCGYACPLGALIDLFSILERIPNIFQKRLSGRCERSDRNSSSNRSVNRTDSCDFRSKNRTHDKLKNSNLLMSLPLLVALFVLISSALGMSLFMIFDPIVLLTRFFATVFFPLTDTALDQLMDILYLNETLVSYVDSATLKLSGILVFSEPRIFESTIPIAIVFMATIGLNLFGKRFWCRYICPLGGLLGLLGLTPLYRRTVDALACTECLACEKKCEMGAIRNKGLSTDGSRCMLCMTCRKACRKTAISHGFKPYLTSEMPSRRSLLVAIFASISAAIIIPLDVLSMNYKNGREGSLHNRRYLIRPPGILDENDFLDACTRCGECFKICPSNTIQPAIFQYGIESLWTPHLVFDSGACEYNCSKCGDACPTGAIQNITLAEKQKKVIGIAHINREKCIPWASGRICMVCQELCPLPKKAIEFKQAGPNKTDTQQKNRSNSFGRRGLHGKLKNERLGVNSNHMTSAGKPYVVETRCIGCGICEEHCPVSGEKAIRIKSTCKT